MIKVTYECPSANGFPVIHIFICTTDEQAEHICKMIDARKENGYKLIDVTRE